jgi:hypothetical protein
MGGGGCKGFKWIVDKETLQRHKDSEIWLCRTCSEANGNLTEETMQGDKGQTHTDGQNMEIM